MAFTEPQLVEIKRRLLGQPVIFSTIHDYDQDKPTWAASGYRDEAATAFKTSDVFESNITNIHGLNSMFGHRKGLLAFWKTRSETASREMRELERSARAMGWTVLYRADLKAVMAVEIPVAQQPIIESIKLAPNGETYGDW